MNYKTTTFLQLVTVVFITTCIIVYLNIYQEVISLDGTSNANTPLNKISLNEFKYTENVKPAPNTKYIEQPGANNMTKEFLNSTNVPKYIIHWHGGWHWPGEEIKPIPAHKLPRRCGGCIVTSNRTKVNSTSTGAVIFDYMHMSLQTMPKERNPDQYYVYFTKEAPKHLQMKRPDLKDFDGVFNLTMSYKRSSDIYTPYNIMSDVLREIKNKYKHTQDSGISLVMQAKKRFAVWVASNCRSTAGSAKRFNLVEKMVQAGIDVDRRGRCFPNNPPPPGDRQHRGSAEQMEFMSSSKFYVAFENSHHCKDYITEKLYKNSFLVGSVPIVWGPIKEDYEAVLPPHSYICMDDFGGNMTKLADYLNYLDRNDTAYKEYLNWRLMDVKEMYGYGINTNTCQLCEFINGENVDNTSTLTHENYTTSSKQIPNRIVKSLVDYTFGEEEPECTL